MRTIKGTLMYVAAISLVVIALILFTPYTICRYIKNRYTSILDIITINKLINRLSWKKE